MTSTKMTDLVNDIFSIFATMLKLGAHTLVHYTD